MHWVSSLKPCSVAQPRPTGELLIFLEIEVRPHRRTAERYSETESFSRIGVEQSIELEPLATLPASVIDSDGAAKVFDHLILRMQLALLRAEPAFTKMVEKVVALAALLEAKSAIPMIAAQLQLLLEVQSEEYWRHATLASLEDLRIRLRSLVKLIDAVVRPIVVTDFADEIGADSPVRSLLPEASPGVDIECFGAKALHFLQKHEQKPAIQHLKWNEPVTAADLAELKSIFMSEGSSPMELAAMTRNVSGLGLFVRSLIGLDRIAARSAFQSFLSGRIHSANQLQFVELVVDYLTRRGYVDPAQLYDPPFTDNHSAGIGGLFSDPEVAEMVVILSAIRNNSELGSIPPSF